MIFYTKKLVIGVLLISIMMPAASPISKGDTRIISTVAGGLTGVLAAYGVYKLIVNGKTSEAKKALEQVKEAGIQGDAGYVSIESSDKSDDLAVDNVDGDPDDIIVISDGQGSADLSLSAAEWFGVILVGVAAGIVTKFAAHVLFDYFDIGGNPPPGGSGEKAGQRRGVPVREQTNQPDPRCVQEEERNLSRDVPRDEGLPYRRDEQINQQPVNAFVLSPEVLQGLPEDAECGICKEPARDEAIVENEYDRRGSGTLRTACCLAYYHAHCLRSWMRGGEQTCPTCRRDLRPQQ